MNIIVFGANGKVGTKVVAKLLDRGHNVTAFIYGKSSFPSNEKLHVVSGDVHNSENIEQAIAGCDVVISTLGSWGTKTKDILTAGMQNIIPAMQLHHVHRIVTLTGAGALAPNDKPTVIDRLNRWLLLRVARPILEDGEEHLRLLHESTLDWTTVRSPVMRERGKPGKYILGEEPPLPWATIVRDDVATALVELAENNQWDKKAPFIRRH